MRIDAELMRVLIVGAGVGGIAAARGLMRDGHDVTVFEQSPTVRAAGGAVTIWSDGMAVLDQLGVDMTGAGQQLSAVRVRTASGRRVADLDVAAVDAELGVCTQMVPRRELLARLLDGFPLDRIRCGMDVVGVDARGSQQARLDFADGDSVVGDLVIGADGVRSVVRGAVGAGPVGHTGWCSWQGLVTLPDVAASDVAWLIIGDGGNLGVWPAGHDEVQWWFDLPWSPDFVRPESPVAVLRRHFAGWSEGSDTVLAALTDDNLVASPFPHQRHPVPQRWSAGLAVLVGDAAHAMPPTLAQGTNQALLDTMVLRHCLSETIDLPTALRRYGTLRRRRVSAVSWVTARQVAHGEAALRSAAFVSNRFATALLTRFLAIVCHRRLSARITARSCRTG